jgi:hypothetical protein
VLLLLLLLLLPSLLLLPPLHAYWVGAAGGGGPKLGAASTASPLGRGGGSFGGLGPHASSLFCQSVRYWARADWLPSPSWGAFLGTDWPRELALP